jgi:hypothetical protein
MVFAVKCSKHYPGYEIAHAPNADILKQQFPSWNACDLDAGSITPLPDNGQYDDILKDKLFEWTLDFQRMH